MSYLTTKFVSELNPCDYNFSKTSPIKTPPIRILRSRKYNVLSVLKQIRRFLEDGCLLGESWKKSGVRSSDTFYSWIKEYHSPDRIKNYLRTAQQRGYSYLDESVEGAFYKKLKEGRGTGSEYEFFLTNRRPDRWKKTTEFAPSESGAPILKQRPIINYIAVHAENATVEVGGNGNGHGNNGNGKRIEEHA